MQLKEIAASFVSAGVSILPIRLGGSKAPAIPAWKELQEQLPSDAEVEAWFRKPSGIAAVCGRVSGGLEVIDFDHDAEKVFWKWHSKVERIAIRLPIVETPSFGFHVYFRCSEYCGNQKIASSNDRKVKIETRGEGGYVIAPGSAEGVHKSGRPYIQFAGPSLPDVPMVTPDERRKLWRAALDFDETKSVEQEIERRLHQKDYRSRSNGQMTPWDDFNRRADWIDLLRSAGWKSRDGEHWTRPGKKSGTSATLRQTRDGEAMVLVVFSSSAGFQPGTKRAFDFYAESKFGGDYKAAASVLRQEGFGNAR